MRRYNMDHLSDDKAALHRHLVRNRSFEIPAEVPPTLDFRSSNMSPTYSVNTTSSLPFVPSFAAPSLSYGHEVRAGIHDNVWHPSASTTVSQPQPTYFSGEAHDNPTSFWAPQTSIATTGGMAATPGAGPFHDTLPVDSGLSSFPRDEPETSSYGLLHESTNLSTAPEHDFQPQPFGQFAPSQHQYLPQFMGLGNFGHTDWTGQAQSTYGLGLHGFQSSTKMGFQDALHHTAEPYVDASWASQSSVGARNNIMGDWAWNPPTPSNGLVQNPDDVKPLVSPSVASLGSMQGFSNDGYAMTEEQEYYTMTGEPSTQGTAYSSAPTPGLTMSGYSPPEDWDDPTSGVPDAATDQRGPVGTLVEEDKTSDLGYSRNDKIVGLTGEVKTRDEFLIEAKTNGMSYKEIKTVGRFTEAESTLRGRFRTLTKEKTQRVRKPTWKPKDEMLLARAVIATTYGPTQPLDRSLLRIVDEGRVPWKKVGEYIVQNGGSYHFGTSTCKQKFQAIMGRAPPPKSRSLKTRRLS